MWIKKKTNYGFKWIWKHEITSNFIDIVGLTKPKAYSTSWCKANNIGYKPREYKQPISAIIIITPKARFCYLVKAKVNQLTIRKQYKALILEILRELNVKAIKADSKFIWLNKHGIKVEIIPKWRNVCEYYNGLKRGIHVRFRYKTPKSIVLNAYLLYLRKNFIIINLDEFLGWLDNENLESP